MNVFIPRKPDFMPSKKIFLARAGVRYSEVINDENIMKDVNRIYLMGLENAEPKVFGRYLKEQSYLINVFLQNSRYIGNSLFS